MLALSIKNLKKSYNNKTHALKGVDLEIKKGDFFALLGANGAGKTTLIGIISGLLNKSSGTVKVFDINQDNNPNAIKKLIGLMPQEFNFNPFDPIIETLINQAGYHGIHAKDAKEQVDFLLKEMQLWDKRFDMAKSLSGGMKRRLMLARALVHKPKILILDEPSAGVDVEIRQSMWRFLKKLNKDDGVTIILTTHYLEEAESLCRNIAILNEGDVIANTSMKKLLAKIDKQVLILETEDKLPNDINTSEFNSQILDDYSLQVTLDKKTNITQTINILAQKNINITHIRSTQNRLETLFFLLTKK